MNTANGQIDEGMETIDKLNFLKFNTENIKSFLIKQYTRFLSQSKFIGVTGGLDSITASIASNEVIEPYYKSIINISKNDLQYESGFKKTLFKTLAKATPKVQKVILNLIDPLNININVEAFVKFQTLIINRISYLEREFVNFDQIQMKQISDLIASLPKSGLIIANGDDQILKKICEDSNVEKLFFGTDSKTSSVWAGNIKLNNFHTTFELNYGVERVEITSPIWGYKQFYPLLAAAALGVSLDIPLINIKKNIEKIKPIPGKMEVLEGFNNSIIINDTLNENPLSFEESIDSLNTVNARKRAVVFSEFSTFKDHLAKIYKETARKIYKDKIDYVFILGDATRLLSEELGKLGMSTERIVNSSSTNQLVDNIANVLAKGDVLLVLGSDKLKLIDVVRKLIVK